MKLTVYRALARGVVLESIRRKDLWVVAILAFLIVVAASALGLFGTAGLETFMKDLAVSVLGLFSTIIAVLTSCRMMPEELKNRTLYPLLARPITRMDLLIGKFVGSVAVSWLGFVILCGATGVALATFHVGFQMVMLQYVVGKLMGLTVVCGLGIALSILMTPAAAATMTFILVFGSTMFTRALVLASQSSAPGLKGVFQVVNGFLPQVSLFDFGGRVVYQGWSFVPLWIMGALFAYMAVYSGAMLCIAWAKFRRQAL